LSSWYNISFNLIRHCIWKYILWDHNFGWSGQWACVHLSRGLTLPLTLTVFWDHVCHYTHSCFIGNSPVLLFGYLSVVLY